MSRIFGHACCLSVCAVRQSQPPRKNGGPPAGWIGASVIARPVQVPGEAVRFAGAFGVTEARARAHGGVWSGPPANSEATPPPLCCCDSKVETVGADSRMHATEETLHEHTTTRCKNRPSSLLAS